MDYKQMAVINERKLKAENEKLKIQIGILNARIEELEEQLDYECGCNKELVATQKQNDMLQRRCQNLLRVIEDIYDTIDTRIYCNSKEKK